jgi:hypothetical protein
MLKAKLIAMNEMDEYEVTLEINGATLICFAVVCPYKIELGKIYPIELSLSVSDELEPKELNEAVHGFKKIGSRYKYLLCGELNVDKLNLDLFSIQDDYLGQFPELDGKCIELEVQGLWVTFLPL